jgi:uncharacterized Zn finger protein
MSKELKCPKCSNDGIFDVYSTNGCDDPHAWIHCPDCTHIWQPNPPKEREQ